MKKVLFILLVLFPFSLNSQEILSIQNKLRDRNGEPIPFASIINISTNSHGTTSDEQGNFLLKTRNNLKDKIQINALGFYELSSTLAEFLELDKKGGIYLKEKPITLVEVEVNGERYEQKFIGKSIELLNKLNGELYSDAIGDKPGLSEGVYVTPNRKTSGLMDKIHFYVTKDGSMNTAFSLRLLRSNDKLENNQGYKLDEFEDMLDSPLVIETFKVGWNSFDLYNFDIPLDKRPFFILFTSLETLDASKKREPEQSLESVNFGTFANRTAKEIYKAISFNGVLVYLANERVKTPIPAVYIEYSELK